jgi:FMN-dependent NADH-azoreductase
MNTLLHIDSSATARGSVSRKLTAEFTAAWRASRAGEKVIYRDLDKAPVHAIDHSLLTALAAAPGALLNDDQRRALALSDHLVDELFEADAYVLGVPVYNFSVPGVFKAWIDQVARKGRVLQASPQGLQGALRGKKVLVFATRTQEAGGDVLRAEPDFHEPFLRTIFEYFGVKDFAYIPVVQNILRSAPELQAAHLAAQLEKARVSMREVLVRWNAEAAAAHAVHESDHKVAA